MEGVKIPKSDAGARDVPVFAPLLPHLERQARSLGPDPDPAAPFFPARGQWGYMSAPACRSTRRAATARYREWTAARLPRLLLHEARHTFASHLIAAGFDVATVAEWVGHTRPSFTLDRS